jgi:hypothetical protein
MEDDMLLKRLTIVGVAVVVLGLALQVQPSGDAHAQLMCKEQSDRELYCGDGCQTDWYDWYSDEASGYWMATIASQPHCEDCCTEETCRQDSVVAFRDTCWCDATSCY